METKVNGEDFEPMETGRALLTDINPGDLEMQDL